MKSSTGLSARDLLPPAVPRVHDVGDHVNVLAMALNLSLPFALALVLRPSLRFDRLGASIAVVLTVAALFLTLSRSAWLAAGPGVLLLLIGWGTAKGSGNLLARLRTYRQPAIAAAVLTAVAILLAGTLVAL